MLSSTTTLPSSVTATSCGARVCWIVEVLLDPPEHLAVEVAGAQRVEEDGPEVPVGEDQLACAELLATRRTS